jgi:DNA modification methylase
MGNGAKRGVRVIASSESGGSGEPAKKTVDPRNQLNDLTSSEWISETVSVWRQRGLGAGHPDAAIERQHPAPFSFTDVARLIRFFSKRGEMVLDPFVGVGSTLKAAAVEGRSAVGIELMPDFADLARERLILEVGENEIDPELTHEVILGDCRDVLPSLEPESIDFIVTSPPYWNILRKEDHKAKQERKDKGLKTRYSLDDPRDLGNIDDYEQFLDELVDVFGLAAQSLRMNRYAAIVVGDFREGGRYRVFHADLASRLEAIGFVLKGITILHQTHKRVFPYGYPFAYVPNLHHQFILILRREGQPVE